MRSSTVAAFVVLALLAAACSSGDGGDDAGEAEAADEGVDEVRTSGSGFVDEGRWSEQAMAYLRHATGELHPDSIFNVMAHIERSRRDPDFRFDATRISVTDLSETFDKLADLRDTSDFDVAYLLNLWHCCRGELAPELVAEIERAVLDHKYWYTDPDREGVRDDQYYWTENHQIMFHVAEYLAGQAFPEEVFALTGMTGEEHRVRAAGQIREWMDHRVRFGFSEWQSHVYYKKDLEALISLAEWSADEELSTRAMMLVDVLLFEIAAHLQNGAFGTSHGRSYLKDKMTALDEDTWNLAVLLFDDAASSGFQSRGDQMATLLARAERYRMPEVIRRIAASDEVAVSRERMGIPLDPTAPVEPDPTAPYGFSYDDVDLWWAMGGMLAWQVVPASIETIERHDLWETSNFEPYAALEGLAGELGPEGSRQLAQQQAHVLSTPLLSEVDLQTWRAPEVMLSTAQRWRPGSRSEQVHAWQATIDPNAQVFTTHPADDPPGRDELDTDGDGYWTGTASMPASAQHENVAVHIYDPAYSDGYRDYTHAWFPQDHFDEVRSEGRWTLGRAGDGYVALWSWRQPRWRPVDESTPPLEGLTRPWDLLAEGGAENVWVVEVARAEDHPSFDAFVEAVVDADLEVVERGQGFEVRYRSPSQGEMVYDGGAEVSVAGGTVALHDYPRIDSPYAQVPFDTDLYRFEWDGASLELDFAAGTREAGG